MAHAQKPDFVLRRKGQVHLNRQGASVQSTTGSRGVRISGSNAGYTMFRGSVKGTGYPLHSLVSPSLPLPCIAVCHHISAALYCCTVPIERPGCSTVNSTTCNTDQHTDCPECLLPCLSSVPHRSLPNPVQFNTPHSFCHYTWYSHKYQQRR